MTLAADCEAAWRLPAHASLARGPRESRRQPQCEKSSDGRRWSSRPPSVTVPSATLADHVVGVVLGRTKKEMLWSYAPRHVASMADELVVGNRTDRQFVRETMRVNWSPANADPTVVSVSAVAEPWPARSEFWTSDLASSVDHRPELIDLRWCERERNRDRKPMVAGAFTPREASGSECGAARRNDDPALAPKEPLPGAAMIGASDNGPVPESAPGHVQRVDANVAAARLTASTSKRVTRYSALDPAFASHDPSLGRRDNAICCAQHEPMTEASPAEIEEPSPADLDARE